MRYFKILVVLFSALLIITGCGKKKEQQILDLQAKNEKLAEDYSKKDSLLNELFSSINEIEKNLSAITAREKLITDAPVEEKRLNEDVRARIMEEIILINNIMEENKKRLVMLRDQLKKSDMKASALQETIKMLTKKLEEKEEEIAGLKDQLIQLNFTVDALNATVDTLRQVTAYQSEVISRQDAVIGDMNTIWYVVGTKKDLTDRGIIEKAGGLFSGEVKTKVMDDLALFTAADIRDLSVIAFECDRAELVTNHPDGSYKFIVENELIKGIEILNKKDFWKSSRFLVIMTR
jgi:hypothetical protein